MRQGGHAMAFMGPNIAETLLQNLEAPIQDLRFRSSDLETWVLA